MKERMRTIVILLCAGLCCLAVHAAAEENPYRYEYSPPKDLVIDKPVTLRYSAYAHAQYNKFRLEDAKRFEKFFMKEVNGRLVKMVTIKYEPIPFRAYRRKVKTQLVGKTAPDIFFCNYIHKQLAGYGRLLDLTPYIEEDRKYFDQIYPEFLDLFRVNGRIYGLPGNNNISVLYYNKTLFDRAGLDYPDETWDWNRLLEAAKKLTTRDDKGRVRIFGLADIGTFEKLIVQNGGAVWSDDGKTCIMNTPAARESLTFLRDLMYRHRVMPSAAEETDFRKNDLFKLGRAAMFVAARWWTVEFKGLTSVDWATAPLPKSFSGSRANGMGCNPLGINADTRHPRLAFEFLKFLIRPQGIKRLIDVGDSIPIRRTPETWAYFKSLRPDNVAYEQSSRELFTSNVYETPYLSYNRVKVIWKRHYDTFIAQPEPGTGHFKISADEALSRMEEELNRTIAFNIMKEQTRKDMRPTWKFYLFWLAVIGIVTLVIPKTKKRNETVNKR